VEKLHRFVDRELQYLVNVQSLIANIENAALEPGPFAFFANQLRRNASQWSARQVAPSFQET
jgi:hypothetical protein